MYRSYADYCAAQRKLSSSRLLDAHCEAVQIAPADLASIKEAAIALYRDHGQSELCHAYVQATLNYLVALKHL